MKKLKINLSDLSGKELNAREQHSLRGGDLYYESCCNCACCYQGEEGGSDIVTNAGANSLQGKDSICGPTLACALNNGDGSVTSVDYCTSGPEY